jgi:hypothetical protein
LERMQAAFPDRIGKIIARLREVRGGAMTDGEFFRRHAGTGVYWNMIEQLFSVAKRRAGFTDDEAGAIPSTFRRPGVEQTALF